MQNLLKSFRPFLEILKYFGYLPFNLQSDGSLKFSVLKTLYSVTLQLILNYFLYLRIKHFDEYRMEGSFISKVSFTFAILTTSLFFTMTVVLNLINREIFDIFLREMLNFDNEV